MIAVPAAASAQGNIVKDLLQDLGLAKDNGGGGGSAEPAAGAPPTYTPPLHGSNPHGQGDVATVDVLPDNALPQPGTVDGGPTITVGQSRGEQDASGNYHGRVVLLDENLLNLVNVSVETNEGQNNNGPLEPLQDLLDTLCTSAALGPAGCVEVAAINSATTANGSQNSFELAGTNIGVTTPLGPVGLVTSTASSTGDISDDGTCQTATGTSGVEDASVSLLVLPTISATALQGSSSSTACNNGAAPTTTNSSSVVGLQGAGLALPTTGCEDGTPNTNFTPLAPLVSLVCNADNSNTGQTGAPYGVREALTVFAVALLGNPLLKATTAGPESHAVAPTATTPPTNPPGDGGGGGNEGGGGGGGGGGGNPGGGPTSTVAQPGGDELAFTGANMTVLGLLGLTLIVGGLGIARASTRRHQRSAA